MKNLILVAAALLFFGCGVARAQVGPLQAQRNLGDLSNVTAAQGFLNMGGLSTKSVGSVSVQWTGGSSNAVVADTYYLMLSAPYAGSITSVDYLTGGTTPSFTIAVKINGVNVTGCAGLAVASSSKATTTCTGSAAFGIGQTITLVVSGVTGTPFDAIVSVNYNVTR